MGTYEDQIYRRCTLTFVVGVYEVTVSLSVLNVLAGDHHCYLLWRAVLRFRSTHINYGEL